MAGHISTKPNKTSNCGKVSVKPNHNGVKHMSAKPAGNKNYGNCSCK